MEMSEARSELLIWEEKKEKVAKGDLVRKDGAGQWN